MSHSPAPDRPSSPLIPLEPTAAASLPWWRQGWPWFLIALPGVVVIACFFTLWLALRHPDAEVDGFHKHGTVILDKTGHPTTESPSE